MKCFYSGADAVGICRSCGRGLSLGFATEFPQGLACKNRCEADVKQWSKLPELEQKLSELTATLQRNQNATALISAVFCLLAGGAFVYFTGFAGGLSLTSFMGLAFAAYGLYSLIRALRARAKL